MNSNHVWTSRVLKCELSFNSPASQSDLISFWSIMHCTHTSHTQEQLRNKLKKWWEMLINWIYSTHPISGIWLDFDDVVIIIGIGASDIITIIFVARCCSHISSVYWLIDWSDWFYVIASIDIVGQRRGERTMKRYQNTIVAWVWAWWLMAGCLGGWLGWFVCWFG